MNDHWDSISTATPLEDMRKFQAEAEAEILGLNATALSPERLAISTAMVAAMGQPVPPPKEVPSPVQRTRKRRSSAMRMARSSSWINDATMGMLGRGWQP